MEDEDIAPNTVHKTDPVGMGRKTLYLNIVFWRNFLPIPTGSAVCTNLAQYPHLQFCRLIFNLHTTYSSMVVGTVPVQPEEIFV